MARCFGFISDQGCSRGTEGWVCAMWGSVGIPTASPGFGDIRGRTKSTRVPGVGTETQWGALRQSRRCKFPGAGKSRLDHCPLLLSISHGSAQTAGSGVVGGSGEGLWEHGGCFWDEPCELQAQFVLCCSAAKPCPATGTSTAAVLLHPCPCPSPQVAVSCSWRGSSLGPEGLGGLILVWGRMQHFI